MTIHFQTELALHMHGAVSDVRHDVASTRGIVSDIHHDVASTREIVSDIHRAVVKGKEGVDIRNQTVGICCAQFVVPNPYNCLDSSQVCIFD